MKETFVKKYRRFFCEENLCRTNFVGKYRRNETRAHRARAPRTQHLHLLYVPHGGDWDTCEMLRKKVIEIDRINFGKKYGRTFCEQIWKKKCQSKVTS